MRKLYTLLVVMLMTMLQLQANPIDFKDTDSNVFGHVVDKTTKEHIPYVNIFIKGTTIGTTTDATGHYFLKNLPEGKFTLIAKSIGYKDSSYEFVSVKGKTLEINFEIEEDMISLDNVVVTANRNETTRRLAPTLVTVLDPGTFEKTSSQTLSQGLKFQPGVRIENNCQNCGFNQVRINGLEGPYSQILIDSRSIFSALSGVYGLEQIPTNMIERVEIVRGGGSALYGSSAIGGVINIITREPLRNSGEFSHTSTFYNDFGQVENNVMFNASVLTDNNKAGITTFGQYNYRPGIDVDNDNFTEMPNLRNRSLGFHAFYKLSPYSKLSLEYHNLHEYRRGGNKLDRPAHEANITEGLQHYINSGNVKYDWLSPNGHDKLSVFSSMQRTNRDSYYGGSGEKWGEIPQIKEGMSKEEIEEINGLIDDHNARLLSYGNTKDLSFQVGSQYMHGFDKLLFMPSELTLGAEYNYYDLKDRSGYRLIPIEQLNNTYSALAQNEWKNDKFGILIGGRLDHTNLKDKGNKNDDLSLTIFSPRINFRYNPTKDINFRLSYSEGFRAPQYFDEELHVDQAGGEIITRLLSKDLKEERSKSVSGSIDWYQRFGAFQVNLLAEGFYTKLNDVFDTDLKELDGKSIREVVNRKDGAKVYGVNLEGRFAYSSWIQLQGGVTLQKSEFVNARQIFEEEDNITSKKFMRTPDFYGYFVTTITPTKGFDINLSGNYTGKMYVPHMAPEEFDASSPYRLAKENTLERTSDFMEFNLKANYTFKISKTMNMQINAGVNNMFNSFQSDFDQGPDRDSGYIYGPSLPRRYFVGTKFMF